MILYNHTRGDAPEKQEEINMKNANVKKINTVGKVSRIVLTVFKVFVIIGIVGSLVGVVLGIIGAATVPEDAFKADISVNGSITVDGHNVSSFLSPAIVDLEKTDISFSLKNFDVKLLIDEFKDGSISGYTIDGSAYLIDSTWVMLGIVGVCAVSAIGCAVMLVVIIFGIRLAKALETCDSPFEEKVLKAMKGFAFSLIPIGVIVFWVNGVLGLTTAFIVAAIILFVYIFKYGAELQQESDETV